MSRVLFDTPPISINPEIATALGLPAAVFLQQVHYWVQEKQKNPKKYHLSFQDGHWWIYDKLEEIQDKMPFLGAVPTIKRMIAKLKAEKVLVVANYNKFGGDRTNWYRIDYSVLKHMIHQRDQNDPPEGSKRSVGGDQNDPCYTKDYTETTTKTTTNQQATDQTADPGQADPVLAELKDFDDQNIHPVIAKVFKACGITGPDAVSKHMMWAEGLLRQYGFEAVEQQAEWLPYRKNVKIPKQYLTSALKDGYEAPQLPPDVELAMQKREMIAQIWANIEGIDDLPVLENGSEYSMCNQRLNAIMRPAFDRAIEAGRVNEGEVFWHRRREAEGVLMGEYFSYNGDMQPVCAYELVFMDWPGRQQDLEAVINAI